MLIKKKDDEELLRLSKYSGYSKPQIKTIVDAFLKGIETDSAFRADSLDKKGQQLVSDAKAGIAVLNEFYSSVRKSQQIAEARLCEDECKSDYSALMMSVRSRGKKRVAGYKEAAERIALESKALGLRYSNTRANFSANVNYFASRLHDKLAADIKLLGLETNVATLKTSAENLRDILVEIDHAKGSDKEHPNYKTARDNAMTALYKLTKYINYDYFMNGTSKFENFASDINATVERVEHSRTMSKAMAEVQKAKEEMKKNGAATETPDAKKDKAHGKHSGSPNANGGTSNANGSASGTNSNGGASASGVNGSSANGSGKSSANGTSSGTNGSSASGTSGTSSNGDVTELHPADEQPSGSGSQPNGGSQQPSNGGSSQQPSNGGSSQQPSDNGTQQPGSGSGDGGLSPAM
ncbi:MAG: hypothetical protein K5854_01110 [Prevotella sp.]|nr:hypothetical protein [Prevotella sp.]